MARLAGMGDGLGLAMIFAVKLVGERAEAIENPVDDRCHDQADKPLINRNGAVDACLFAPQCAGPPQMHCCAVQLGSYNHEAKPVPFHVVPATGN